MPPAPDGLRDLGTAESTPLQPVGALSPVFLLGVVVPLARDLANGLALRLDLRVGSPGEDEDEPPPPGA
jgi:hypothetical protein